MSSDEGSSLATLRAALNLSSTIRDHDYLMIQPQLAFAEARPFGMRRDFVRLGDFATEGLLRLLETEVQSPRREPTQEPGGLRVHQYYRGEAYYLTQQTAHMDLCFRRALAAIETYVNGGSVESWPPAVRPERAGLKLEHASIGSFDAVWSLYGTLAAVAQSSPIAIASLFCMAWDATYLGRRLLDKWRISTDLPSVAQIEHGVGPAAVTGAELSPGVSFLPLLLAAAEQGAAIRLEAQSDAGFVRIEIGGRAKAR